MDRLALRKTIRKRLCCSENEEMFALSMNHRFPFGDKIQTPNIKIQTPKKSQAPNPNSARDVAALELGI